MDSITAALPEQKCTEHTRDDCEGIQSFLLIAESHAWRFLTDSSLVFSPWCSIIAGIL